MFLRVPHAISVYRVQRMVHYLSGFLKATTPLTVLDVGCGGGHITKALQDTFTAYRFSGVDVMPRSESGIPFSVYDGKTLPFDDHSFDVVMLVDVLHHSDDPTTLLQECSRVMRQYMVIKDHIADSWWDRQRLTFLDWFGNRPFDIPMPYNFFTSRQWDTLFDTVKLTQANRIRELQICPPPFYYPFDHDLHFIAKLARP